MRKPIWPKVPSEFVRAVLKGHSSLGLAFAALIYLVCLTGTIAVFSHEFERWENPSAPRLETASPEAVQAGYTAALDATGKGVEHVFITMPDADLPRLTVTTDVGGHYRSWAADERGTIVEASSPWTEFLTRLHINLHLPRTIGIFLVGLIGVALLSSLISGLLAHPRIFRDAFHLRLGGSRRLQEADLHNRLGIWALPFHITVSLTGALLGLTTIIVGALGFAMFQGDVNKVYALFVPPHPVDNPAPAPPLDLRPMFAQVAKLTDGRVAYVFMEHPTEMGGAALFNVEDGSNRLSHTDAYTFDRNAKLYFSKKAEANNVGEQILGSLGVLHFGWFGGSVVKIAYGLLGLGLTYLAASGVTIWLARRRDKGRSAPGWERVWTAVVWGQPVALVAAAGVTLVGIGVSMSLALAIWGGVTVAALVAAALLPAAPLSRLGKIATVGLLIALALAHMVLRGGEDPIAWTVNAVLIGLGLVLLWFARSAGRAAAV
ncbi:PepSY domain-containing protein [Sphingomonas sp. BT-65]|uniref:PepSY-associated TM helix domain-containing protein n=1 Tax=Sphingomonas sp. BT-65 TaxID=2989821 RepID=UPI00223544A9|nr:PepSY-associated TM helix domain-containing protein [Sphingomonas sp. BT-65]MCW4463506.1 PepSY domain-containing protein [Sphingomonas sp. BT-65]